MCEKERERERERKRERGKEREKERERVKKKHYIISRLLFLRGDVDLRDVWVAWVGRPPQRHVQLALPLPVQLTKQDVVVSSIILFRSFSTAAQLRVYK